MATACTQGLDTGFVDLGYMKVAVLGVVQGISEAAHFLHRAYAHRAGVAGLE